MEFIRGKRVPGTVTWSDGKSKLPGVFSCGPGNFHASFFFAKKPQPYVPWMQGWHDAV
jgi:hypothetical protein